MLLSAFLYTEVTNDIEDEMQIMGLKWALKVSVWKYYVTVYNSRVSVIAHVYFVNKAEG